MLNETLCPPRKLMPTDQLNIKAVANVSAAFIVLMLATLALPRSDFVLVVGWPGMTEARMMQVIADAGGSFVAGGAHSWLAVAHAESAGLPSRLMGAGAMLVLDHSLAVGCMENN
jgi:hypothetical protein